MKDLATLHIMLYEHNTAHYAVCMQHCTLCSMNVALTSWSQM